MRLDQFDVVANPDGRSQTFAPFLVILQSRFVDLDTVVVAPAVRDKPPNGVDPAVTIEGEDLTLAVTELAAVERRALRRPVASLSDREDEIRRALDRLFTGF